MELLRRQRPRDGADDRTLLEGEALGDAVERDLGLESLLGRIEPHRLRRRDLALRVEVLREQLESTPGRLRAHPFAQAGLLA